MNDLPRLEETSTSSRNPRIRLGNPSFARFSSGESLPVLSCVGGGILQPCTTASDHVGAIFGDLF